MLKHMKNNIEITVSNNMNKSNDDTIDDDWDPMRDEYFDPNINAYEHGPGANLDIEVQRPAYRDRNNQIVWKLRVDRIPCGLTRTGLENLFLNFGTPNISYCQADSRDKLNWAIIEYKTLAEAQAAIVALGSNSIFQNMRVTYAKSDEAIERMRKKRQEEERQYAENLRQMSNNYQPCFQDEAPGKVNRHGHIRRLLGRGLSSCRGRVIVRACRDGYDRGAGRQNCAWSNGIPDFRDSTGILFDPRSDRCRSTNEVFQSLVVTAGGNSLRKVAMGRGFIPPEKETIHVDPQSHPHHGRIGTDVLVPVQPCVNCGSETPQKCSVCGTPYCSVQCQKIDFRRHRNMCTTKESIDVIMDNVVQNTMRLAPLCQKDNLLQTPGNFLPNRFWGKPEKNVFSVLQSGMETILVINSSGDGKYYGTLTCSAVFEACQKLCTELPEQMKNTCINTLDWPSVGMLLAVRCFDSVWRGYVTAIPCLGSSTKYRVALCDLGKTVEVDIVDLLTLPVSYHTLPELAVSCEVIQTLPNVVGEDKQLQLNILNCSINGATATVLGENKSELGIVSLSPWMPPCTNELSPISVEPPCDVVITAYHHQGAIYVRPVGKTTQEQLFTLLQKVAAVHITSPTLDRPPYKGEMVACRYKKDGNFYRAIVSEAASSNEYSVIFVDFGNLDTASVQDMKPLPQELKMFPCMSVRVSLKGVREGPLTQDATQLLNRISLKEQQFKLECSRTSAEGVELFYPDKRSLNRQLDELLMPDWEIQMKKGAEPHRGEVYLLEDIPVLELLKDGQKKGKVNVVVSNVMPDGRISVCPIDRPEVDHVLQTMAFQLNEYCESTDSNSSYNPRLNEVCLAKYTDGMWYRAVNIETITPTQSCQVYFLDYGNTEVVQFKDIRRMVPDFKPIPVIMSMCTVDGTPPNRTLEVIKRINELVTLNKMYEVDVLETIELGDYKIHIPEISNQLKSEFGQ
ncbi:Protein vreteno [Frankliniella fusca]|uniref:Protein vreteno n=1 Tax=Frankliniella fusca TaxID=407009 RepID=A0AAE1HDI4_9NEOP|nr:Protein vreteno [Frankliniella fusca]